MVVSENTLMTSAAAVLDDDVFDDRGRLGQQQITVLDQRSRAQRMQRLQLRRREEGDGVARAMPKLVGKPQFFAEPDDAFGLGMAEVMDSEHGVSRVEGAEGASAAANGGRAVEGGSRHGAAVVRRLEARAEGGGRAFSVARALKRGTVQRAETLSAPS